MGSRFLLPGLIDAASVTASSAVTNFPATNVQDEQRTLYHEFNGKSGYYSVDFGDLKTINGLAIINHNMTTSASITVQAGTSAGGSDLYSGVFAPWESLWGFGEGGFGLHGFGGYLSPSEVGVYFPAGTLCLIELPTSITARYWKITVDDSTNSGNVRVGRLIMDSFWETERYPRTGMQNTPVDPSTVSYSVGGQAWRDNLTKFREAIITFEDVPESESYGLFYAMLLQVGVGVSFVADLIPDAEVMGQKYHNRLYCHIPDSNGGGSGIEPLTETILARTNVNLHLRESR